MSTVQISAPFIGGLGAQNVWSLPSYLPASNEEVAAREGDGDGEVHRVVIPGNLYFG